MRCFLADRHNVLSMLVEPFLEQVDTSPTGTFAGKTYNKLADHFNSLWM